SPDPRRRPRTCRRRSRDTAAAPVAPATTWGTSRSSRGNAVSMWLLTSRSSLWKPAAYRSALLEPCDERSLVLGRDRGRILTAADRGRMSRARKTHHGDVGVAGPSRGALPGRDARVDRLPLIVFAVEQEHGYAHLSEDRFRVEVHVRPD